MINGEPHYCCIQRMMFTTALIVGLDKFLYKYRYCFHTYDEAVNSLNNWDGVNDPPGNWIKRKGEGGDIINPFYIPMKA